MSDEPPSKLLKEMSGPDEPDEHDISIKHLLVDFENTPAVTPPQETVDNVSAKFVKKLFGELYQEPIKQIDGTPTFGEWIRGMRNEVRLSVKILATSLRKDPSYVEQLEQGEISPCKLNTADAADIVCLFRIHIQAVRQLVVSSYMKSVPGLLSSLTKIPSSAPPLLPRVHRMMTNDSEEESSSDVSKKSIEDEIATTIGPWMTNLSTELQRRQETNLLF